MSSKSPTELTGRLGSWKEIAAFFGRDERTVKRWEKERGLPVHRIPGGSRGSVYASTEELTEWLESRRASEAAGTETFYAAVVATNGDGAPPARSTLLAGAAWVGIAIAVIALVALGTWLSASSLRGRAIDSIVVLPFTVSQSAEQQSAEFVSEGLTDGLIDDLSQLSSLRVIPRSSALRFKGRDADPIAIAKQFGVRGVITGRVAQQGDTIVISAELTDAARDSQIWGAQFTRKVADLLPMQQEISQEIAEKLRVPITGEEKSRLAKRDTENPEAYALYLRGRYYWNKRSADSLKKSVESLQQAVNKDGNYALAYAGLADSYNLLSYYDAAPPRDSLPLARGYVDRALQLDPDLAEAHTSSARLRAVYDHDWPAAESEVDRALQINPNYATARQWYAMYLTFSGRFGEANSQMEQALHLDPLSLIANDAAAMIDYYSRDAEKALAQFKATLDMDPSFGPSHREIGMAFELQGNYAQAVSEFEAARHSAPDDLHLAGWLGHTYALAGSNAKAQNMLDELQRRSLAGYVPAYSRGVIYAALKKNDDAFAWLGKACDERDEWIIKLKVDPLFDNLRNDPRFGDLLHCVGLSR